METKLIIIAAPSGAGKTTLCEHLLGDYSDRVLPSISCTTRSPRPGETNGVEYIFLSKTEFENRIKEGDFIEWAEVHGNYYGTSRSVIENAISEGKSVLLDIDVQGAKSLTQAFPDRCVTIFVSPPNMTILEKRLRTRGTDSEEQIQKRITNAKAEMARANEFQHQIVNDDLARAYEQLKSILRPVLEG